MLAQPTLPRGVHWRYEPKLDGFRGLLWHGDGATVQLLSRNVKDLSAWFPEVVQAGNALPSNTLLDGEIVIADDGGCSDFGALQARLGTARRDVARVASQRPAVLLCFDLLTLAGEDLTSLPLSDRRRRLEHLVGGLHPCLQLVMQTGDRQIAQEWLTILTSVEGVVAKRADGPLMIWSSVTVTLPLRSPGSRRSLATARSSGWVPRQPRTFRLFRSGLQNLTALSA